MNASVLIPDAGTGPANSLVRSLRAGGLALRLVGYNSDPFTLRKSAADRNYLVPRADNPRFLHTIQHVIDTEDIGLVIPNTDDEVEYFSETGRGLAVCGFLPRPETVHLCLDKYALYERLTAHGIAVPATYPVPGWDGLEATWRRLGDASPVWCRIRKGTASSGATPVKSLEHARGWMRQWEEIRGIAPSMFTLSECLPGRDFACQSLWKHGRLVLIKTVERLSYFGASDRASGVSGIAALAKTVDDPRIVDVCTRAVLAVDPEATGAFSLDLKENARGEPCLTEINPGRFITMMNLFDLSGRSNMAATLVRLALGDDCADIAQPYDPAEGYYFIRHSDTVPVVVHRDALFEGLLDVRATESPGAAGDEPREDGSRLALEVAGNLDIHLLEALRVEIDDLARRHGVTITQLGLER
jgi:carbamoyl-phosphate synthase large subunit